MAAPLFGLECELGLSVVSHTGQRLNTNVALERFLALCAERFPHLEGGGRLYLQNAAVLYPDCGHPEYCSPECCTPEALLKALRAGEHMVAGIARELEGHAEIDQVSLFRTNVDYAAPCVTWGCHDKKIRENDNV